MSPGLIRCAEQEYTDIGTVCDRLLRGPGTSLARIAISPLHLLNEHPGCLAAYEPLLHSGPDSRTPLKIMQLADGPRAFVRAGRALARSNWAKNAATPLRTSEVVVVSHLTNLSQLHQPDDFYFGALQRLLHERGAASTLILINRLPDPSAVYTTPLGPVPFARIVLPHILPALEEARIWRQCLAAHRSLREEGQNHNRHDRTALSTAVARLAARHAMLVSTPVNLRLNAALANVFRAVAPRIVITTYEGDASERMIWHAARSAARHTSRQPPLCVGYQHTRLLRRAHAIRRSVRAPGIDCDPDVILTLGDIPHADLASSPGLSSSKLLVYGSHRRFEPEERQPPRERPRVCLVLPDADVNECAVLFEFALECARNDPGLRFALRPHPASSIAALRSRQELLRELPVNVTLGGNTPFERACAQARYCLYRGSSAALHALEAGIKPIYLERQGELTFDPLFGLAKWRETVTSPHEFAARIRDSERSPDEDGMQQAAAFYDRYVSRVNPGTLDELLALGHRS